MLFEICLDDIAQELGCTGPACPVIVFDEAPISKIPLCQSHMSLGRAGVFTPMRFYPLGVHSCHELGLGRHGILTQVTKGWRSVTCFLEYVFRLRRIG